MPTGNEAVPTVPHAPLIDQGLDLDDLIDYMEKNDYTGLENITGIPGSNPKSVAAIGVKIS